MIQKLLTASGEPSAVWRVVTGMNTTLPLLAWLPEIPITLRLTGPLAVRSVIESPTFLPAVLAIVRPSTATRARSATSAVVYQRPLRMSVLISGWACRPRAETSLPFTRTTLVMPAWTWDTPWVELTSRCASVLNGLLATAWAQMSKWFWSYH